MSATMASYSETTPRAARTIKPTRTARAKKLFWWLTPGGDPRMVDRGEFRLPVDVAAASAASDHRSQELFGPAL